MRMLDIDTWERKQHFAHFKDFNDPYFGVTIPFKVSHAYKSAKDSGVSFFARYLHDCMKAINDIDALRYRIIDDKVVIYDVIHASSTLPRTNKTFAFSYIEYNSLLSIFENNITKEKLRIENSTNLYPPNNGLDCIHCSALPWFKFNGHKEPVSGKQDSVPKFAFSGTYKDADQLMMNVSINVNHALVDGYDLGLFAEKFQDNLDRAECR